MQAEYKQKAATHASAALAVPPGVAAAATPGGASAAQTVAMTHESHYAKIQAMMAEMTKSLHESSNQASGAPPAGWAAAPPSWIAGGGGLSTFVSMGMYGGAGPSEKSNGVGYGGDMRGDAMREGGAAARAAAAARVAAQLHGDRQALAALRFIRGMLSLQAARGSDVPPQLSAVVVAVLDSRGLRYCLRLLLQNDSLAGGLRLMEAGCI